MWEEGGRRQNSTTSPYRCPLRLETGQMDETSSVHKATLQLSGQRSVTIEMETNLSGTPGDAQFRNQEAEMLGEGE